MFKSLLGASLLGAFVLAISPVQSFAADEAASPSNNDTITIAKRSKPRVPGGSGCDDPRDLIEHPECNLAKPADDAFTIAKRSKPRVPGGSGCDDPRDLIEHPECGA